VDVGDYQNSHGSIRFAKRRPALANKELPADAGTELILCEKP
jgi:hypothetical protein